MEILALWRSPLDKVAITEAAALCQRQPHCSIGFGEDFSAMTIYNFGYYIDHTLGGPNDALNAMLLAMSASPTGGRGFIPQKSFEVNASASGHTVPDQCDIDGSGGGGHLVTVGASPFYHFVITPMGPGNSIFFNCSAASGQTNGGVYLRSLAFQWASSTHKADTCINTGLTNTRAINCTFTDCPCAFSAQQNSCTLEQCTIEYTVSTPVNTKAVIIGSTQCGVIGPGVFAQTSPAPSSGGATGCTCISIEGAEHPIVSDMQILEWTIGVDFSQNSNSRFAQLTNCDIECWQSALNIQLQTATSNTLAGVKVVGCTLAKASDSTDTNPVVVIDTNGNSNQLLLNDVALIDCTVCNLAPAPAHSAQHGLLIAGGSNIKVIGGTYSNNGPAGAGIAITGTCQDIQIIGANLQPSYPGAPNMNTQEYALLVSSSPTGAFLVSGCDMTGYSSAGPVSVSATQTKLFIYDCPGYNDKNTHLTATPTMLTMGVWAATCSTPYFGPSVIIYSGSTTTLSVFGQSITSAFGIVFLPSPYDEIRFSTAPSTFTWIGK